MSNLLNTLFLLMKFKWNSLLTYLPSRRLQFQTQIVKYRLIRKVRKRTGGKLQNKNRFTITPRSIQSSKYPQGEELSRFQFRKKGICLDQ